MIAMRAPRKTTILITAGLLLAAAAVVYFVNRSEKVDYNADVKPIINKKCISCHGGVKKQGGFSLLFREEALGITKSGRKGIVPGKPGESEMIRRLTLSDEEERMPYKEHPLSKQEINILTKWIEQGATWGKHWAYQTVTLPEVPAAPRRLLGLLPGKQPDWIKNEIDAFVYAPLKEQDLSPSPEADKATLLRRVSLDLTGLPPSRALAKQFLGDNADNAYEKLVDSLLASPAYGERWTAMWMDLARYSDTKGYERDDHRSMSRYRDWLIRAFNDDKPYDQFLVEQIAGDLLPNPTTAQYIATAFHRNTMTNDEGGTDNEEFRTAAVMDRVSTTWEALMGTTFACVQCHSHPYDPFRHEEYYQFLAYFNNTRDEDTYEDYPILREYGGVEKIKFEKFCAWATQYLPAEKAAELIRFLQTTQPSVNSLLADEMINSALADTKWLALRNHARARIKKVVLENKTELICRYNAHHPNGKLTIHLDSLNGPVLKTIVPMVTKGWDVATISIPAVPGVHDLWFTYEHPALTKEENGVMFSWFYFTDPLPGKEHPGYDSATVYFNDLVRSRGYKGTPVMMENPASWQRTTNVFERGNWMVKGQEVHPGVPRSLSPLPQKAPPNRMGLALWLVDKKNPLVSRTITNRIWEQFFGKGIVETLEDLGSQGIMPTHRELLDWLSYKLMYDYKWSLKKLMKELVLSATYRQDSRTTREQLQKDPFNKYYARGPRVRLAAEQLRDQALAVSGLLSKKMYGESVFPYQPEGIWLSPYSNSSWKMSAGEDKYRRTLYTYWKRTAPYPFTMMFDGAAREVCSARRINTNTPLQALVTLNDSAYLVMSRRMAREMQEKDPRDVKAQINTGYQQMMYKPIPAEKLNILTGLYNESLKTFQAHPEKALAMMGKDSTENSPSLAALAVVANAMLNLDEWITKN